MASTRDVLLIGIIIFGLGLGLFVLYYFTSTITTQIVAIPAIAQSSEAVAVFNAQSSVTSKLDYIIFGIFIGLVIAMLITGWFVGGNPLFAAVYFLIVVVSVAAGAVMSNVWETMTQASVFGTTVNNFPLTNNLLSYLPIYMTILGFLGLIVMFAKPYLTGEASGGTY